MVTYQDCSIEEFNETMKKRDMNVEDLTDRELCILFTKYLFWVLILCYGIKNRY